MHPYEIDTEQVLFSLEKLNVKDKSVALRHHQLQFKNRKTMKRKIEKLFNNFSFSNILTVLQNEKI